MAVVSAAAAATLLLQRHSFSSALPLKLHTFSCSKWASGICTFHTHAANSAAAAQARTAAVQVEEQPALNLEAELEERVENFTEVGVVIRKHGIRGELLIKSFTDFPEEHFEKPGTRWMSFYERGRQRLQRVELLKGRISVGKVPCWLITFKDVTSPEEAAYYIGATMVVKREDGPALEEAEFNVNLPARVLKVDTPSKRDLKEEARKEALRAKRKLQERKGGLKKSLAKTKQEHLLEGLSTGDEEQQNMLLEELLEVDFKLLQASFEKAMQKRECTLKGFSSVPQRYYAGKDWVRNDLFERIQDAEIDVKRWWKQGLKLIANKKAVVASTIGSGESADGLEAAASLLRFHAERLSAVQRAATLEFPEKACEIQWFICTSKKSVEPINKLIQEQSFFGLKQSQIRVLPQESIPCFEAEAESHHRVLRSSPWKLITKPGGEGGVLKALSTEGLVDELEKQGVRFIQVVDGENAASRIGDPTFFGFAQAQKSEMSIQVMIRFQPGKQVLGFDVQREKEKNEDGVKYELVYSKTTQELLNGAFPLGSCVISLAFAKRLQDVGYEYQMDLEMISVSCYSEEAGKCEEEEQSVVRMKYSLLDCLKMVQERKVSLLEVKYEDS